MPGHAMPGDFDLRLAVIAFAVAVLTMARLSTLAPWPALAIALPVVSLVITPLARLGAILPARWLLPPAHGVLALLMAGARPACPAAGRCVAAARPGGQGGRARDRGSPLDADAPRISGTLGQCALAAADASRAAGDCAWRRQVVGLDVGQGLAVVVRTASDALVTEAGPRYSLEADAGNRVIVPYLRGGGATSVDALVVTHDDIDHAGGAASVMRVFSASALYTSIDAASPLVAGEASFRLPCVAGQGWRRDGVDFEVLHPRGATAARPQRTSDRSCVVKVSAGGFHAWSTGDLEEGAERELLAGDALALRADVALGPHHGQPHVVGLRVRRSGGAALCRGPGGLSQSVRASEIRPARPLCRRRRRDPSR